MARGVKGKRRKTSGTYKRTTCTRWTSYEIDDSIIQDMKCVTLMLSGARLSVIIIRTLVGKHESFPKNLQEECRRSG